MDTAFAPTDAVIDLPVFEPVRAHKRRRWVGRTATYVILLIGAIAFAFPFYWMITTSLKPEDEVLKFPPDLIPSTLQFSNYTEALSSFKFGRSFLNTMIIIVGTLVGRLISIPLAGYAFARLRFPLRGPLFILVLSTMMLPYYVTLIPQFLVFRDLGWLNTFLPLIVPAFFGVGGAFFIFMFRQFYLSIPADYDEAAMLDGCGHLRVFWHIILPQSRPALAVMAIFTFLAEWNDYFGPLIYLTDSNKYTLALNFQIWVQTQATGIGFEPQPFNRIMAISTLITLVPVVVFFFTQRYFFRGLVVSGIKA